MGTSASGLKPYTEPMISKTEATGDIVFGGVAELI